MPISDDIEEVFSCRILMRNDWIEIVENVVNNFGEEGTYE